MNETLFHGSVVTTNRIIYTPSSFAKSSLLHMQEIGMLQATYPHTSKRENLASFLFFIVQSGSGSLVYEGKTYELVTGDCVFIDCKKPYAHTTSTDLWKLQWVHFYGPSAINIHEKYSERGGLTVFHPQTTANFSSLLDDLYKIGQSEDYIKDMLINEKLASLLTLLMRESWQPDHQGNSSPKKQSIQIIKEYLDTHYKEAISLDDLANEFFINKFYLTRVFKSQYGLTIHNYLLQTRITHAKQLLRFTNDTLATISAECGMGDGAYFSRMFKQFEGVSPGKFRKLWQYTDD